MAPGYRAYLKQVRRALCCSRAEQKRLLAGLEQEMTEAFPDAGGVSLRGLAERFGEPEAMAQELQQALPGAAAAHAAKKRIRRTWLIFFVSLFAVLAVAVCVVWIEHARAERARLEAENTPPEVIVLEPPTKVVVVEPPQTVELPAEQAE